MYLNNPKITICIHLVSALPCALRSQMQQATEMENKPETTETEMQNHVEKKEVLDNTSSFSVYSPQPKDTKDSDEGEPSHHCEDHDDYDSCDGYSNDYTYESYDSYPRDYDPGCWTPRILLQQYTQYDWLQ